jgi:hypothetical protein
MVRPRNRNRAHGPETFRLGAQLAARGGCAGYKQVLVLSSVIRSSDHVPCKTA